MLYKGRRGCRLYSLVTLLSELVSAIRNLPKRGEIKHMRNGYIKILNYFEYDQTLRRTRTINEASAEIIEKKRVGTHALPSSPVG